jgi:aerotaxis receptor
VARQAVVPTLVERPFEIEELFFSTTDKKAVIRSGNGVFARVSGYTRAEDLIGKPHNIIRHPDMPRSVFRVFWDFLEAGEPVAAYVKNMAADGGFYWVMALVIPTEAGYLSIRFKPSSPTLNQIQAIYSRVRAIELQHDADNEDRKLGMELGVSALQDAIRELGFSGYDALMQTALAREMSSRDAILKARASAGAAMAVRRGSTQSVTAAASALEPMLAHLRTIAHHLEVLFAVVEAFLELNVRLTAEAAFLWEIARSIRLLSLNALVQCTHLGETGQSLAVIAARMAKLSAESTETIGETAEGIRDLVALLREAAFIITSARLQAEMAVFFVEELLADRQTPSPDSQPEALLMRTEDDLALLVDTISENAARILGQLPTVKRPVSALTAQADRLATSLRMLGQIHIAGKVEAARADHTTQFAALFERVRGQVSDAQTELIGFSDVTRALASDIARIEAPARSIQEAIRSLAATPSRRLVETVAPARLPKGSRVAA